MRPWVFVLLTAAAAIAAEPSFKEIFDPFHRAFPEGGNRIQLKRKAFDRAVEKRGLGAAIRAARQFEAALAAIQKRLDKDHATYEDVSARWWGWRRKHERDYRKKHGRPPAEYPIPPGLNQEFLDKEKQFRKTRSLKLREMLFQDWVVERIAERLGKDARAKAVSAAAGGLKGKNLHHRLRCARLLATVKANEAATAALDAALQRERQPSVLAALIEARGQGDAFLSHPAWPVRAAAVRTTPADRLKERLALEEGRLRDDIEDALRRPRKKPERETAPGVFSNGPTEFFGIKTSSRALIYCLDGSTPGAWDFIREEAQRSIDSLPDGALFGLVVYARGARKWKKTLAPAGAGTRKTAADFLAKHQPGGGADLHAGLTAAFDLAGGGRTQPPAADTLFLMTLRGPGSGLLEDPRQVALEATRRNALLGLRVHAFGASAGREAFYLQAIANQFRGTHREPG